MAKYIHVDSKNVYYRAIHTVNPSLGVDMMAGASVHTIFSSMNKVWRNIGADQLVYYREGKPWRNEIYPKYKYNRILKKLDQTEEERETSSILFDAYEEFSKYIEEKTNVLTISCPIAESDDMIAIFIQMHPEDEHVIISTDSDFIQMLKHDNVTIYNGVTDITYTKDAILDGHGNKRAFEVKSDGKVKVGEVDNSFVPEPNWYEYAMFIKYIRGDKSDNIFSAYPGARIKGTKNKVGINDAFDDRHNKGYKWNNFMLQSWTDHEGNETTVKERFELNKILIDLESQPEEVVEFCKGYIYDALDVEPVSSVGIHFMRFCGQWDLKRISEQAQDYGRMLNSRVKP